MRLSLFYSIDMTQLLHPCGFDTLEYSWVKATIGICILVDYSVAKKYQQWHHLRCYMVVGAKTCCFVMRLENGSFWTRHIAGSRETSSHGEREPKDCIVKMEGLR
jgi:hypothetical protein